MERIFTIFTLFYFVFKGKFQVQALRGAYIRRVFCVTILGGLYLEGLIFGILRYLICILLMHYIYFIHIIQVFSFVCVLTWTLLGVKKRLGPAQIGSFRALIQNFRRTSPPLSNAEFPPPGQKALDGNNSSTIVAMAAVDWSSIFRPANGYESSDQPV